MRIDFKTTKLSAVPTSQTYTGRARTSPKVTYSTVRTKRRRHTNENNRNKRACIAKSVDDYQGRI